MDVTGVNFQSGAVVNLDNPHINLTSVQVISCTHIQLLATIEPTSSNIRPAHIGRVDLTVSNPDSVFGTKTQAFEVLLNPPTCGAPNPAVFGVNTKAEGSRVGTTPG